MAATSRIVQGGIAMNIAQLFFQVLGMEIIFIVVMLAIIAFGFLWVRLIIKVIEKYFL